METIQEQIEASQHGEGADRWEHYRRAALLELRRMGIEKLEEVIAWAAENPRERYTAWMNESLIWTIDSIRRGRNAEAIRGYLQVVDYASKTGWWPSHVQDAFIVLRNHFEDLIRDGERYRTSEKAS